jgi:hypothetical protein
MRPVDILRRITVPSVYPAEPAIRLRLISAARRRTACSIRSLQSGRYEGEPSGGSGRAPIGSARGPLSAGALFRATRPAAIACSSVSLRPDPTSCLVTRSGLSGLSGHGPERQREAPPPRQASFRSCAFSRKSGWDTQGNSAGPTRFRADAARREIPRDDCSPTRPTRPSPTF